MFWTRKMVMCTKMHAWEGVKIEFKYVDELVCTWFGKRFEQWLRDHTWHYVGE